MGSDEQYHLPLRPVADAIYLPENDAKEKNLAQKPEHLDDEPEDKIRLETHLPDERVAQHDRINFEIAAHHKSSSTSTFSSSSDADKDSEEAEEEEWTSRYCNQIRCGTVIIPYLCILSYAETKGFDC